MHGIDTTFLVQVEISSHPRHAEAKETLDRLLEDEGEFALAPTVMHEFIHVVTDARRFSEPLAMGDALARAEMWWQAVEVRQVFPTGESVVLGLQWLRRHQLGRKRILDTMLAAAYREGGVDTIVTGNARDYRIFECFHVIEV